MATSRSRSHTPVRPTSPNVFSDDYALEEYEITNEVAGARLGRENSSASFPPYQQTASPQQNFDPPTSSIPRSRWSQRSNGRASMRSRTEEIPLGPRRTNSEMTRTSSIGYAPSRRSGSTIIPRAASPYQGATGPSQPYGMYPQDVTMSRTVSVATTSTMRRPERVYSGPGGPTQPYGMYAQNTVPEDEDATGGLAPPIAPGFPGLRQNYRRQQGPDGDDADDLIGPDGYTEQLPPYTRFPNGIPPKYDSASSDLPALPQQPLQEAFSPQRQEVVFLPQEDYVTTAEPHSPATSNPFTDVHSAPASSTTAVDSLQRDEKGSLKERIRRKGTRKVCCGLLPCWLLVFVVVVLCLAILLGGVIGGIVAHHSTFQTQAPPPPPPPSYVPAAMPTTTIVATATTAGDAIPIATPSGLPPLPTGSFYLILDNPSTTTNSCLVDSAQQNAWDCSTGAGLNITVGVGPMNVPMIDIAYDQPQGSQLRYGAQPPEFDGPANLRVVQDRDEWNKGAAYFFNKSYNKTVIVRNQDFPNPSKMKRALGEKRQSDWTQAEYALPSDRPWYCFWNNTVLEGFIYVTQDDNGGSSQNAVSTNEMPSASPTAGAKRLRRDASSNQTPPSGKPYPKVVKVEERRPKARIAQAYCQQMQILNNGQPGPIGDPVNLQEVEPPLQHEYPLQGGTSQSPSSPQASPSPGPQRFARRQQGPTTNCMCEWQN